MEAHGTGTKAGDPQELETIVSVFKTPQREGPIQIGSVKSNAGHTECSAGKKVIVYFS